MRKVNEKQELLIISLRLKLAFEIKGLYLIRKPN